MKRNIDLFLTVIASIVLFPLFVMLALCVRLLLGKPVLFRQQRPGLHGKPFTIYKFRTMTDRSDPFSSGL